MKKAGLKSNLKDWLFYLENLGINAIDLGLSRVKKVADSMQLLPIKCKTVIVGGTNGKGSTVHAIESIYQSAGYNTGSYTSPHLFKVNERIKYNGVCISDDKLCEALSEVEKRRKDVHLTYFETLTLAAFCYFKQLELDILVIEVGLGGRLDATNIIDADVSIITTVDIDHQDYLGDTVEKIAEEKAGILRENQCFIYADETIPKSISNKINLLNCESYCLNKDFIISRSKASFEIQQDDYCLQIDHSGINQHSAAVAVVLRNYLNDSLPVSEENLKSTLNHISLNGRLQYVPGKINKLFDVAHNIQSSKLLAEFIKNKENINKIHVVFSALGDKDLVGMITPIKGLANYWYPATLHNERAASSDEIVSAFATCNISINNIFPSVAKAYTKAMDMAGPGDLIVTYGSFYTVSKALSLEKKNNNTVRKVTESNKIPL